MNKKNFEDEESPHELFLTTRQTTKIRNAFANNMSTDIKLSKTQISKIIKSGDLPVLVSNLTASSTNKFDKKISGKAAVRPGKKFTLFISNEDMNDIVKIIKPLEDSGVLIDGVTETVKKEIKKQGGFLGAFSRVISTTSNFFGSKRYNWKKS